MKKIISLLALMAAATTASAVNYQLRVSSPGLKSPLTPAQLQFSSADGDFGSTTLGESGAKSFQLTNVGQQSTGLTMGPLPPPFSVQNNQCGAHLGPAESCSFSVSYAPVVARPDSVSLEVAYDEGAITLPLSGTGVPRPALVAISDSNWDFGKISVGATGTKTVQLTNSGGVAAALTLGQLAAPFSLVNNLCTTSLAPAAACSFTVNYKPTGTAGDHAVLSLAYDQKPLSLTLNGVGAPPDSAWTAVNLGRHNWYPVAFGNGRFVTVANDQINTSTDGITWNTLKPTGLTSSFKTMVFANGKFVALSNGGGAVATSMDGQNWQFSPMANGAWYGMAYGNGTYVAVDASQNTPTIGTSADGVTWSVKSSSKRWKNVAFGAGKFVTATWGVSNTVGVSADGVSWTNVTLPVSVDGKVSYANGQFILMGGTYAITSPDGLTWTQYNLPTDVAGSPVIAYGNGKYMAISAVGAGGVSLTSLDGRSWTQVSIPQYSWNDIAYGNGKFVASTYNTNYLGYSN